MRNMLLFIVLFAMAGCAVKKVNFDQLQDRNGLFYLVNSDKPFTGEVVSYANGRVEFEGEIKDGLREGLWSYYFPSGQKKIEGAYAYGLKEGTWTYWKDNGQQDVIEMYKMGKRLGNDGSPEPEVEKKDSIVQQQPVQPVVKEPEPKKDEPKKPKLVEWERLSGGPVKYLDGIPYTGLVVKHRPDGRLELEGEFYEGRRTGKWTFYDLFGNPRIRYY
ncbi:MAG: hypothetical protein WCO93_04685 [bacterium]